MHSKSFLVSLLGLACLVSSCFSFPPEAAFCWAETERHLRVDPARDVVEYIEITHGLSDPTDDAADQLRAVLKGARVFPAAGGWLSISFDEPERTPVVEGDLFCFSELAHTVRVVEARLVLDEKSEPSLWRRVRIECASSWLSGFQDLMTRDIDDATPGSTFGLPYELTLDPASLDLLRAELRKGFQIWKFDGGTLLMEVPTTAALAERFIEAQRSNIAKPDDPEVTYEFSDGWLSVRLAPDQSGWIRLNVDSEPREVAAPPPTPVPLGDIGLAIEPTSTYARLRREAGLN